MCMHGWVPLLSTWIYHNIVNQLCSNIKCVHAKSLQSCPTLCNPMDPTRLLYPWDSPGKNTGTGCHALHQGIFPTQGSNPNLLQFLHCRWILYCWATRETHLPPLPTINALGQVPIISHLMDYCQSPIQVSSHYSPTSWFIPARVSHKAKSYDH